MSERTLEDRFWSKVDKIGDCWIWTGAITSRGYGNFRIGYTNACAHRVAWELLRGPIPEGLVVDHLCRNRACVNPDHLEPVAQQANVARGLLPMVTRARHRSQTHCKHGHPLFGENLRVDKRGFRSCRTCMKRYKLTYAARRKARAEA